MPKVIAADKAHARAVVHRKAEARWVKKNLQRHRRAARDYYKRNRTKILAQKKQARTSSHRALVQANRERLGGGLLGRPRKY